MHKSFFKNLFWLQFLNWLIKPIWILLIEREVQLQLGDMGYGEYAVHLNLGTLFAVLLDAGINTYISREISVRGKLWDMKRILYLRFALAATYIIAVLVFAFFQGEINFPILFMVIVNQLLAATTLLFRAVLQGKHRFVWDSILSVTDRFVAIITLIFVFGLLGDGLRGIVDSASSSHAEATIAIEDYVAQNIQSQKVAVESSIQKFLLAQMLGYVVAVMLALIFVWKSRKSDHEHSQEASAEADDFTPWLGWGDWLKQMGWYVAMGLAMSAFTRLDVQMLQWFTTDIAKDPSFQNKLPFTAGFNENGLYAKGFRFLDAALIFSSMLSVQLLPLFSKKFAQKESLQSLVWLSFRIVLVVGMSAFFVSFFYGKSLMQLFYHLNSDAEAHNIGMLFSGFMLAFVAMSSVHVFGTLLTAMGEVKWLTGLALVALVVNILINIWQIPLLGAFGAVEACILTQWIFAIACIWRAHQRQGFTWQWNQFEFIGKTIGIFAVIFTVIKYGFPPMQLLVSLSVALVISLLTLLFIGFSEELKLLKEKFTSFRR